MKLFMLWASFLMAAQDPPKAPPPGEVRAYLLDSAHAPVSVNGISALLVCREASGIETLVPMTIVTTPGEPRKAPHCPLPIRDVEGSAQVAALCALGPDGRLLPERKEDKESTDGERLEVHTDVPYFRADLPSDAVLPGGCTLSLRFRIRGVYHSTRPFPRFTTEKGGAAFSLAQQLDAELSLLERHLRENQFELAGVDLDRSSVLLAVNEPKATREALRQDCLEQSRRVRAALASRDPEKATAAARKFRELCSACYREDTEPRQ